MIETLQQNITYLTKQGFKPSFNIINNVVSKAIKKYLDEEEIKMQAVEPNNHRVNAAERAIQTFKNHFVAGLGIGDKDFPTNPTGARLTQFTPDLEGAPKSISVPCP